MGGHKKRLPPLDSLEGVQHNLQRLIREARRGEIDINDASKITYMLKTLADLLTVTDIERRLNALEADGHPQPMRLVR